VASRSNEGGFGAPDRRHGRKEGSISLASLLTPQNESQQEKVGNAGRRRFIKILGAAEAAPAASAAAGVARGPLSALKVKPNASVWPQPGLVA